MQIYLFIKIDTLRSYPLEQDRPKRWLILQQFWLQSSLISQHLCPKNKKPTLFGKYSYQINQDPMSIVRTPQEHAMAITSNVYMNSTTKFIRANSQAFRPNQQIKQNNTPAAHSLQKMQQQPKIGPLSRKNKQTKPQIEKELNKNTNQPPIIAPKKQQNSPVKSAEEMAMHMSANIFLNTTTRFVKGLAQLSKADSPTAKSIIDKKPSPPKPTNDRSIGNAKSNALTPKKAATPAKQIYTFVNTPNSNPSVTSIIHSDTSKPQAPIQPKTQVQSLPQIQIKPQVQAKPSSENRTQNQPKSKIEENSPSKSSIAKNPQTSAYNLTGQTYLNSTTKFMRQPQTPNDLATTKTSPIPITKTSPNPINKISPNPIAKTSPTPAPIPSPATKTSPNPIAKIALSPATKISPINQHPSNIQPTPQNQQNSSKAKPQVASSSLKSNSPKNPQTNAHNMAGDAYLNSTTKYVKNVPLQCNVPAVITNSPKKHQPPPQRQKLVTPIKSTIGLELESRTDIANPQFNAIRNRFQSQTLKTNSATSPADNEAESTKRIQRKRQKTREIKFGQKKDEPVSIIIQKEPASKQTISTVKPNQKQIAKQTSPPSNQNKPNNYKSSNVPLTANQVNIPPQKGTSNSKVSSPIKNEPKSSKDKYIANFSNAQSKIVQDPKTEKETSVPQRTAPFSRQPNTARTPVIVANQTVNEQVRPISGKKASMSQKSQQVARLESPYKKNVKKEQLSPEVSKSPRFGGIDSTAKASEIVPVQIKSKAIYKAAPLQKDIQRNVQQAFNKNQTANAQLKRNKSEASTLIPKKQANIQPQQKKIQEQKSAIHTAKNIPQKVTPPEIIHPTNIKSNQATKKTDTQTNKLAASKSTDNFERVWTAPVARPKPNNQSILNPPQVQKSKVIEQKQIPAKPKPQKQANTLVQQPKVQHPHTYRQQIKKEKQPINLKSSPAQDASHRQQKPKAVIVKQNPQVKKEVVPQPINTNKSTKVINNNINNNNINKQEHNNTQPNITQNKSIRTSKIVTTVNPPTVIEPQKAYNNTQVQTASNKSIRTAISPSVITESPKVNSNQVYKTQPQSIRTSKITSVSPPVVASLTKQIPKPIIASSPQIASNNKIGSSPTITSNKQIGGTNAQTKVQKNSTKQNQNTVVSSQVQIPSNKALSNLKKSQLLLYTISKMLRTNKHFAFKSIDRNNRQTIVHLKEATILIHSIATITGNLVLNNYKLSLAQMKKVLIGSPQNKNITDINAKNTKQKAAALIFKPLVTKLRESFLHLLKHGWINKQLGTFAAPKTDIPASEQIKAKQLNNKQILKKQLTLFLNIVRNYHGSKVRTAFDKILMRSIVGGAKKKVQQTIPTSVSPNKKEILQARSPQKPQRNLQQEKKILIQHKQDLQSQILRTQYRTTDKKRSLDIQRAKLIKKMDELTKKEKALEPQVLAKRKKNQQLQNLLNSLSKTDLQLQLPEGEPLVELLTQVYSQIFRNPNQLIDRQRIITQFSLNKEDCNPLIDEWNALAKNVQLKADISKWEGVFKREYKVRQSMKEEQEIQTKLLRNYIRERYLWQWVHEATIKI